MGIAVSMCNIGLIGRVIVQLFLKCVHLVDRLSVFRLLELFSIILVLELVAYKIMTCCRII